jgi:K+-transporting ATPase KdpF subunit
MTDILYLAGTLVFFGLTWLFVKLCERVQEDAMTGLYLFGGIVAVGLLIYLVVALLKPEVFS